MICLIGVDHVIQHGGYLDTCKEVALREFQFYLGQVVQEKGIDIIAEEFSEVALKRSNTDFSTCKELARALKIEHLFCDPTPEEREALKIETAEQREHEWLKRIRGYFHMNILFICGSEHLQSFKRLLAANGFKVAILSDGWGNSYLGKGSVEHFTSDYSQEKHKA
jgi:hypothetical protein